MALMKDPKWYLMLKEKKDGLKSGFLSFPILFNDTKYFLPKEEGEKLVAEGYAKEINVTAQDLDL